MPEEVNSPPCPVHGAPPRALHPHNFFGIVTVIEEIIDTISGVGTTSFSRCPYGYPFNFEGVVRALEDLNLTASGITGGGGGGTASGIVGGSGIYITQSGDFQVINATVLDASGVAFTAGSGLYLSDGGTKFNLFAAGEGGVEITYSGAVAVISGAESSTGGTIVASGSPGDGGFDNGDAWFDTNQGRLFVFVSGVAGASGAWYQTNAEGIALMSDIPPSGDHLNAPARHGSIWFNQLVGSLFVYDETTSGWYETGPQRSVAYGAAPPSPPVAGAGWYDTIDSALKVWNGTSWIST